MRVIAHGPLDKLDATPPLGACIHQAHLMHIVASQPIRGGEYDTCKGCHGAAISETIETGALECGTAVAVITVNMLVTDMPIGLGSDRGVETAELLIARLVLLLTGR
jgi:hypothetical protein